MRLLLLALVSLALLLANPSLARPDRPEGIINGEDEVAAVPYMGFLDIWVNDDLERVPARCGAVLIDPSWALTAAHCFSRPVCATCTELEEIPPSLNLNNTDHGRVLIGGLNRYNDSEFEIRAMVEIIPNPNYWAAPNNGSNNLFNAYDTLLIRLSETILTKEPVELNADHQLPEDGTPLTCVLVYSMPHMHIEVH